jgi:peptidoglycan/LPS O-acetylase OafA/YrhL
MLRSLSSVSFAKVSPENSGFIGAWRGVAALVVLLAHMEQVYLAPTWTKAYPYCILVSQLSVMVFFVLSGFLIGKSITRKTDLAPV